MTLVPTKISGVGNVPIDETLCCEIDHIIEAIFLEEPSNQFLITDIALDKDMARVVLNAFKVLKISGVGRLVKVDEQDIGILLQNLVNEVGTYKTSVAVN